MYNPNVFYTRLLLSPNCELHAKSKPHLLSPKQALENDRLKNHAMGSSFFFQQNY